MAAAREQVAKGLTNCQKLLTLAKQSKIQNKYFYSYIFFFSMMLQNIYVRLQNIHC
jgi:hypothetical protein